MYINLSKNIKTEIHLTPVRSIVLEVEISYLDDDNMDCAEAGVKIAPNAELDKLSDDCKDIIKDELSDILVVMMHKKKFSDIPEWMEFDFTMTEHSFDLKLRG